MNSKAIPKGSTTRTKTPKWVLAIPKGSHGSGDLQKRLWRVVSDYVRIRDWTVYGRCVATGRVISHWKDGDAGHFKAYSKCNGIFKFNPINIHLQSKSSNGFGDFDVGKPTRKSRSIGMAKELSTASKGDRATSHKFTTAEIRDMMRLYITFHGPSDEQPDYLDRVNALL